MKRIAVCGVIIFFVLLFLYINPLGAEHQDTTNDSTHPLTLEEKVNYINSHMSDDERAFRQAYGLGNETIGENYNSMGASSPHF